MDEVLFLTTQFPYPLDNGGKIGSFNGLSVVDGLFDTTVLSFYEDDTFLDEGMKWFSYVFRTVHFEKPVKQDIHIRKKPLKLLNSLISSIVTGKPYLVTKFYNREMKKRIDSYFSSHKHIRYVFVDYLNMNTYGDYIRRKYSGFYDKIILKDHNKEYEIVQTAMLNSKGLKRAVLSIDERKTFRYEVKAIRKADICFSVCDDNTEFLKKYNAKSYTMFPNFKILSPRPLDSGSKKILFLGNLSWKENYDGILWFIDKIFPLVKEVVPEAELDIVGSGPKVKAVANVDGVRFLGYVKDISHIYDDKKVFICPLMEGSGIRIKILEAFNNEIAVVSTTVGCKTIGGKDQSELLIEDKPENFAKAVVRLLLDNDENEKIRKSGKKYLEEHFSLEQVKRTFEMNLDLVNGQDK